MKKHFLSTFLGFALPVLMFAQSAPVQNASIPKDAAVDVTVTDFKNNPLPQEIIIFKSKANTREYTRANR
jgi:hypothetical protein